MMSSQGRQGLCIPEQYHADIFQCPWQWKEVTTAGQELYNA